MPLKIKLFIFLKLPEIKIRTTVLLLLFFIIIIINVSATLGNLNFICNPIELSPLFHHYSHGEDKHDFFFLEVSIFFLFFLCNNSWLFSSFLGNA